VGADRHAIDLVIVGHLAWNEDRTPSGTRTSRGGAAYYCAVGATVGRAPATGVVASVGDDFGTEAVERLGVDTAGLTRVPGGTTARFVITQLAGETRTFAASWGVAKTVDVGSFPIAYRRARHVHLATAPPEQQLVWLEHVGGWTRRPTLSADVFEHFVRRSPEATRSVARAVDVVFMNEEEAALLRAGGQDWPPGDVVLKRGAAGAAYYHGRYPDAPPISAPAPPTRAVETTGAGDVLAGAFLALRMRGASPARALDAAVRVASASVTDFGVDHQQLRHTIAGMRDALLAGSRRDHLRREHRTCPPAV
jgi:sugar/nucleoside kinase (ribokinase family)